MDAQATRSVILPSEERVTVSDTPQKWWTANNSTGFVDPHCIAPDPKNPRKRMSPIRLAELKESITARGVRDPLVVTPSKCAPWVQVAPEHEGCFFLAVSGHRRRECALDVRLGAVPIRVAVYPSEMEHRLDVSLLNKEREDLEPLDEGWELVELRKLGWKVDSLCRSHGYTPAQYYLRVNLTKLHPDLQALLGEASVGGKRRTLSATVGGELGGVKAPSAQELDDLLLMFEEDLKKQHLDVSREPGEMDADERRFLLQKVLFSAIQCRSLSSSRATEFIKDRVLRLPSVRMSSAHHKTKRYQPSRRKELLRNYLKDAGGSVVFDWSAADWQRTFEYATREEVEEFLAKARESQGLLTTTVQKLTYIRDCKKPTNPEVLKLIKEKK